MTNPVWNGTQLNTPSNDQVLENDCAEYCAESCAGTRESATTDPDLVKLIDAWPILPEIYKTESGQMNNSFVWFTEQYPGSTAACVMVIPTRKLGEAAGFNMPVTVIRESSLKKFVRNIQSFFQEFVNAELTDLDPKTLQQWLKSHELETDQIVHNYTEAIQK